MLILLNIFHFSAVTKWDLNKHILNKHVVEPTTFYCEEFDCDFSCTKLTAMRKHERNEHGNGPNIYCCHLCEKRYHCGWSLSRHLIKYHGFQLPSGHRRFTYRQDIDGFYRVQLTRIESLEVSEQFKSKSKASVSMSNDVSYELDEIKKNKNGFTINLVEKKKSGVKQSENVNLDKKLDDPKPGTSTAGENEYVDIDDVVYSSSDGKSLDSANDESSVIGQKDVVSFSDVIIEEAVDSCDMLKNYNSRDGSVQSEPIMSRPFHINSNDRITENSASEIVSVIQSATDDADSDVTPLIKNINDFSVMKRYLRNSTKTNEILITFNEIDEKGNVIQSRTRKATEIEVNNFKQFSSTSK